MINENNLTKYYGEIANKLDEIVPVEWEKIVMYAEELGDVSSASFYFYTNDRSGKLVVHNSGNIPEEYNVSEEIFDSLLQELWIINKDLWLEFKKAAEETWSTLTFYLDNNWKFKVKFGYELNEEIGDFEREIIWAYDELGLIPQGEFGKGILEEYLHDKEKVYKA